VQVVRAADAWRPGVGALALVGLLTAVLVPPGLALRLDAESMDKQLRVLDRVLELTRPEDRVFDCWTGLYLTRRPAHRYFYLNTDIQRLFEPSALQARLLAALRNPEVRLVIWDRDCARLPAAVRHYVANEFTPDRRIAFLKVR
jgi:hypothetical protein